MLSRLVDKSLIVTDELAGENRYSRLETIRQYSREKFAETDEVESIRDRHLEYYVRFAGIANDRMMTRERLAWTMRLEAEQDNLRAALEWGLSRHPESALSLVGDLNAFWTSGGYAAEAYRWTRQALDRAESDSAPERGDNQSRFLLKANALRALAWLCVSLGDPESAQLPAEQSLAMYRQDEKADRRGLVMALQTRASMLGVLGEHQAAERLLKESLVLAREAGETALVTWGLRILGENAVVTEGNLEAAQAYTEEGSRLARAAGLDYMLAVITLTSGEIAAQRNELLQARARFDEAIRAFQKAGARFNVALAKSSLAHMERHSGNYDRALEIYSETITAFRDIGQRGAVAHQLECFGFIALALEQPDRAARLLGAAEALREQTRATMRPYEQTEYQAHVRPFREQMDPALSRQWEQGRAMTMEEAIEYAIRADSSRQLDTAHPPADAHQAV